jgi:hypothetical protein
MVARGRKQKATASDSHSQNCLQTLFFFPFLWWDNNYTCMLKNLLKLYCIWTWDTLWCFFCFVLFCFLFFFPPLMRQWQNYFRDTISKIGGWVTTPKLLRLKLYCIWIWRFFTFLFYLFFSQSSLCLSNACSAYCWLVHYLSLFISLKLFFVCFVFLLVCFSLFL